MTDDLKVKIAAYITGNLSSDEVDAFEKAMANDPELKEEVALERQMYLHINGESEEGTTPENEYTKSLRTYMHGNEAKELDAKLLSARAQYNNKNKKRRNFTLLWAAAVIAALLVAANGFLFTNTQTSGELFDEYYRTEDLPSFRKRGNETSTLQEAIILFNNKEYEEAIGLFDRYMSQEEGANASIYIYTGVSHAALGEEAEAIAAFDKLINSTSIDRSKGLWFKALSYLKLGNMAKAREVLETLKDQKGFNYEKAETLLNQL